MTNGPVAARAAPAPPSVRDMVLAALAAFEAGDFESAADRLANLPVTVKNPELSYMLGAARVSTGQYADGLASLDHALTLNPDFSDAWCCRGMALHRIERHGEALAAFDRAIGLNRLYFDAWFHRTTTLLSLDRCTEALASCDTALDLRPGESGALNQRGLVLHAMDRPAEALAAFEAAIEARADDAEAWMNRGIALDALRRPEAAVASHDHALLHRPDYAEAWYNRGNALKTAARFEEALASFDRAVACRTCFPQAWYNRGLVLETLGRLDDALDSFGAALRHQPVFPECAHNRGLMLYRLGRLDDALTAYDQALADKPHYPGCWSNRGVVLQEMGRPDEAFLSYDTALRQDPAFHEARVNRGVIHFIRGDLATGWVDYESRWHLADMRERLALRPWPLYAGEDLRGRVLAVYYEQGLGDVVQFARYLPLLKGSGGTVVFVAPRKLHRLLQGVAAGCEVRSELDAGARVDFQTSLMSLPAILGTDPDTVPGRLPYLSAEAAVVAKWRPRIGAHGLKIGIAWQGNPHWKVDHGRSFPLASFAPVAALPGVRLVALQKNEGSDQLARLPPDMRVEHPGADFDPGPDAFIDTAAIASLLDLIITSDTSLAHVAGALGRPVWVALKRVPEWRWTMSGDACPWYPTMRLFRQARDGDWTDVFGRIAEAVQVFAAGAGFCSVLCKSST